MLKYACVFNHDPDELNVTPKYLNVLTVFVRLGNIIFHSALNNHHDGKQ